MRKRSQRKKMLYASVMLAALMHLNKSNAILPPTGRIDVWSTRQFQRNELPCLPVQKDKTFTVERTNTEDNAYMMMAASYLAYSFWPGKRSRILTGWGFSGIHLFDDSASNTNGYWAEHNNFVLLVFRGTQEPADLLTDISVHLEPLAENAPSIRVHSGFKRGANAAWSQVETAAHLAQQRNKPLFLAGHSLGGAIALLNALKLENNNFPVRMLWIFGATKIGNNQFFESARTILKDKWQRINQTTDPIPALPFTTDDENQLRSWISSRWGKFIPLLQRFAEHSQYDTPPIVFKDDLKKKEKANHRFPQRESEELMSIRFTGVLYSEFASRAFSQVNPLGQHSMKEASRPVKAALCHFWAR